MPRLERKKRYIVAIQLVTKKACALIELPFLAVGYDFHKWSKVHRRFKKRDDISCDSGFLIDQRVSSFRKALLKLLSYPSEHVELDHLYENLLTRLRLFRLTISIYENIEDSNLILLSTLYHRYSSPIESSNSVKSNGPNSSKKRMLVPLYSLLSPS